MFWEAWWYMVISRCGHGLHRRDGVAALVSQVPDGRHLPFTVPAGKRPGDWQSVTGPTCYTVQGWTFSSESLKLCSIWRSISVYIVSFKRMYEVPTLDISYVFRFWPGFYFHPLCYFCTWGQETSSSCAWMQLEVGSSKHRAELTLLRMQPTSTWCLGICLSHRTV